MIAKLLTAFAALFALRDPDARLVRRTALLWALIVVAGTAVRFWGLGDVGLHGDEKTMSLPAMHLVEHGTPQLPSGMYYARAVGQLYMMAASVKAFGQTEWALRLPSALCGVLLILLAWPAGRRFLTPAWNLALVATVAFLPDFIEDAQTARMYVFLATCIAGYLALLWQWERTGRTSMLAAAVVVLLVGIQFHTLAIFASCLVFFPGLVRGDRRKFALGLAAFAVLVAGFEAINTWISHAYPQDVAAESGAVGNGPRAAFIPHISNAWLAATTLPALLLSVAVIWNRPRMRRPAFVMTAALLALAAVAALSLHYHIAVLLVVAALVIARREGELSPGRFAVFLGFLAALALAQVVYLHWHAAGTSRQIVGLMLGWPSVWPFFSIGANSPVAGVLAVAGLAAGLWLLAHRRPVPDFLLMLTLGVWIPLLMIGFLRWDIPPRYAHAQIVPLLVGACAAAQWGTQQLARLQLRVPQLAPLTAAVVFVLIVDPLRVNDTVAAGYANHPDHKGAALFIESIHPGPHDILVAEDVLQQTYYLGRVDYWLVNKQVAAPFMHRVAGRWLDFYTNTPLLGTGAELQALLQRPDRGAVYVIGSGENQEDGRKLMRSFGIAEELHSPQFKVIFRGRDGITQVWKAEAPRQAAVPGTSAADERG